MLVSKHNKIIPRVVVGCTARVKGLYKICLYVCSVYTGVTFRNGHFDTATHCVAIIQRRRLGIVIIFVYIKYV